VHHQAEQLVKALTFHNACSATYPQVVVLSKTWPQRAEFLKKVTELLETSMVRPPLPGGQMRERYWKFRALYSGDEHKTLEHPSKGDCKSHWSSQSLNLFTDDKDFLPWHMIRLTHESQRGGHSLIGLQEPILEYVAHCPVFAVVDIPAGHAPFLETVVHFCNHGIQGTVSMTLVLHPSLKQLAEQQRAMEGRTRHDDSRKRLMLDEQVEQTLQNLHYGCIGVNVWTGLCSMIPHVAWGPFPGEDWRFPVSGRGVMLNAPLLESTQKTVVHLRLCIPSTSTTLT